MVSCHTADSKPVKQEVNSTVILPPLVFPGRSEAKELWNLEINEIRAKTMTVFGEQQKAGWMDTLTILLKTLLIMNLLYNINNCDSTLCFLNYCYK